MKSVIGVQRVASQGIFCVNSHSLGASPNHRSMHPINVDQILLSLQSSRKIEPFYHGVRQCLDTTDRISMDGKIIIYLHTYTTHREQRSHMDISQNTFPPAKHLHFVDTLQKFINPAEKIHAWVPFTRLTLPLSRCRISDFLPTYFSNLYHVFKFSNF